MSGLLTDENKQDAFAFFKSVQDRLAVALARVDGEAAFERKEWQRAEGGGGTMAVLRGGVVEKAGVNVSQVMGAKFPFSEAAHRDQPFWASGVSTITHMMNPNAPIGHMNTRLITAGDAFWVGGGADLTPFREFPDDTRDFHAALKDACAEYSPTAYEEFSRNCDEYFYIKHRQSARGVGGIFFDDVQGDFSRLFALIRSVADAYVDVFPKILDRRKILSYSPEEKDQQLYWRGRYVEFNLLYDRGTKFGLLTGGNTDAIFVSLPPIVKW